MAKHSILQLRRKEARAGQRDPYYSPERDLAHIGPSIVRGAMVAMEEKFWEPWFRELLEANGVTYDKILETSAPLLMAKALNRVIAVEDPVKAVDESGFSGLPPGIQMAFYVRLGQVLLSAVWAGVKDVGRPDSDPPAAFEELLEDVEKAFRGFLQEEEDAEGASKLAEDSTKQAE